MWAHGPWPLGCTSMSTFCTISQLSWLLWVFRCQISPILISYVTFALLGELRNGYYRWITNSFPFIEFIVTLKMNLGDFSCGPVVENLPANVRDTGSIPSGRIPHALGQLSPFATTTEAWTQKPVLCNKKSHRSEKPEHQNEEWPPLTATRESLWQQRPSTAKKKKKTSTL